MIDTVYVYRLDLPTKLLFFSFAEIKIKKILNSNTSKNMKIHLISRESTFIQHLNVFIARISEKT